MQSTLTPARRPALVLAAALAALLLVAGPPAVAQEEPPVRFLVERIVVEGLEREAARRIVVIESLLHEGRSYSEPELRAAVHRVNRLPFVVDADMALRKGSERGAYELVITVQPARPLFWGANVFANASTNDGSPNPDSHLGLDDDASAAAVGLRRFVGSRGQLFASMQTLDTYIDEYGALVQVGYTQHGLFGGGGYATGALSGTLTSEHGYEDLQASLQVGVPLSSTQALRGALAYTSRRETVDLFQRADVETEEDAWDALLAWVYDSTDDPFAPAEGTKLTAGGEYTDRSRRGLDGPAPIDPFVFIEFESERVLYRLDGRRYWRRTPRQSIGVGGYAWYTSESFRELVDDEAEDLLGVELFHAINFWEGAADRPDGDLRLETAIGLQRLHEEFLLPSLGPPPALVPAEDEDINAVLQVSFLYRNAWGLVRASLFYAHELGGDP